MSSKGTRQRRRRRGRQVGWRSVGVLAAALGVVATTSKPNPASQTLLLVDDEPDIVSSLQMLLQTTRPGLRVLTATTGQQALDILARDGADAIVTDYRMPGMDGVELLRRIREAYPGGVPCMMFTAVADDDLMQRVMKDGLAQHYISKAAPPREFVAAVGLLLADIRGGTASP